jgi:hypothetical protein
MNEYERIACIMVEMLLPNIFKIGMTRLTPDWTGKKAVFHLSNYIAH